MTTIASIRARQGIAPPITEQQRAEYEQAKAARRAKNVVNAREILDRNGVQYLEIEMSPSNTENLTVCFRMRDVHYFPETGLWLDVNCERHFGCRNLVRHLKGEVI